MSNFTSITIRFNKEKIVDKRILDYFDNSLISKTTLVKTALINEIDRLEKQGTTYPNTTNQTNEISKSDEVSKQTDKSSKTKKERLDKNFDAFNDKI